MIKLIKMLQYFYWLWQNLIEFWLEYSTWEVDRKSVKIIAQNIWVIAIFVTFWEIENYLIFFQFSPILKGLSTLKLTCSGFKDYGLLILPLTLIFHFGETPESGRDSGQKMSNPVTKSY